MKEGRVRCWRRQRSIQTTSEPVATVAHGNMQSLTDHQCFAGHLGRNRVYQAVGRGRRRHRVGDVGRRIPLKTCWVGVEGLRHPSLSMFDYSTAERYPSARLGPFDLKRRPHLVPMA
ncbi:hypothetical protein EVAR_87296_1 [Eumeta japonica]|uniref:Uncharacterized protein n=1 Tax=Eumeta variegata TaxID=151549 RepID=A0A4C1VYK2_EUMVA|nr:hypothetical protein EVAR_87296_1 [Eumeta japonica]